MNELEEYFRKLRFDENFHLGLGDVRLTIAMQEEVVAIVALENEWVAQHQNAQQIARLTRFPQCNGCEYNPCDLENNSDYCPARR